jgi:hypothetical protein
MRTFAKVEPMYQYTAMMKVMSEQMTSKLGHSAANRRIRQVSAKQCAGLSRQ